jgi:hypothetical protein
MKNQDSDTSAVAEAEKALCTLAKIRQEKRSVLAAKKSRLVDLATSADISELAKSDPKRARELSAQIAALQSDIAIDELIANGTNEKESEHLAVIRVDCTRMIREIRVLRDTNYTFVHQRVISQLRSLGIYEEERLARLAHEAIPCRKENAFGWQFENLTVLEPEIFQAMELILEKHARTSVLYRIITERAEEIRRN